MAIIITIMVLELRPPEGADPTGLLALTPSFLSYVLSFVFVGIYWNNHHHLFQAVERVNGQVLWANMHLLFWLSLIPFVTAWLGETQCASWPIAMYGIVLLLAGIAYYFLTQALLKLHNEDSVLATVLGNDLKGKLSVIIYMVAIPLAFISAGLAGLLYVVVAIMWLIPDRRIERRFS